ncbi:hypothetical protein [Tranquillimonas rosea]|uniref:hypothetical protein n=1 Tax=Tranquillimonas rosea TaxID=641238 RepID=UPI003BA917E6
MKAVFRIDGVNNATLKDVHAQNAGIGIDATNSEFEVRGATFVNVDQPYHIRDSSGRIENSESKHAVDREVGPSSSAISERRSSVGWSSPSGPRVPCHCKSCDSIFPSKSFDVARARFYLYNNSEVCPICETPGAEVSIGLYDLAEEMVTLLSGPSSSRKLLKEFEGIATSALRGRIDAEDAIKDISSRSPEAGSIYDRAEAFGKAAFGVLLVIQTQIILYEDTMAGLRSIMKDLGLFEHVYQVEHKSE